MKAYRNVLLILATLLLALALSLVALAEPSSPGTASDITLAGTVASKISYQGRLTDAGGNPLTGTYNLVFQLWNDATAGSQVGSDIMKNNVSVSNGLFTVDLDVPQSAFNGQALWLRIQVGGQWLSPRQELLPVPYALSLRPGAWINGNSTDAAVVTVTNQALGTALYAQGSATGIQGVGMTGVWGQGQVGVAGGGLTGVSGSGSWVGVYGESADGYGVRGSTSAPMTATYTAGVYGQSINGRGVIGESQFDVGVYGQSSGEFGAGVGGVGMTGVFGSGAFGVVGSGGVIGVSGYITSDNNTGVEGTATGLGAKGVEGIADNYGGIGVSGHATFGTGVQGNGETGVKGVGSVGYGVWGEGGTGVYGKGTSTSGSGVWGTSTSGTGVWGTSTNGTGVNGQGATGVKGTSSTAYGDGVEGEGPSGVYGRSTSPDGCGGCFVNVDGGIALYAYGNGGTANLATLRVDNSKSGDGMAAYLTNNSGYATAHLQNSGSGEVLVLQSNGGRFLRAVDASWDAKFRLEGDGKVRSDVGFYTPASDFAEMLPAAEGLQPGDVLVIGPDGKLTRASEPYQANVAGVYSTQPGFLGGQPVQGEATGTIPLAITGVVPVKVSAENGAIRPGDLLVTSSIPGYAMKAGSNPPQGTVIGKALEGLDQGTGTIKMLATLQ
jgi:hypothetical protein